MKILVVDDSLTMRKIISNVLKQLDYTDDDIVMAKDGLEAWSIVKKNKFDIILTDWNMPNMGGLELVRNIRETCILNRETPVVMITTEGAKSEVILALKAGVSNYIVKPFSPEVLKEKIESVMKRLNFVV